MLHLRELFRTMGVVIWMIVVGAFRPLSFCVAYQADEWQAGYGVDTDVTSLNGTCFEGYWNHLPSIRSELHDVIQIEVDAFTFTGRMSIYKFLMDHLDDSILWTCQGINSTTGSQTTTAARTTRPYHWLWAYAAQWDWQFRSGRLTRRGDNTPSIVASDSWWGYYNFHLSVSILLGWFRSQATGEEYNLALQVKPVVLLVDDTTRQLMEHDASVKASIQAWESFFRESYAVYGNHFHGGIMEERQYRELRHGLQKDVWRTHLSILETMQKKATYEELLEKLEPAEAEYAKGYTKLVTLLAACTYPTDLVALKRHGAGYFPYQIISDPRWKQSRSASVFDKRRHHTVQATLKLAQGPSSTGPMTALLRRISRTGAISRTMPRTLFELYHGSAWQKVKQTVRLLFLWIRPREWMAVVVGLATASMIHYVIS